MREIRAVRQIVKLALEEDLPLGDVTARWTVSEKTAAKAVVLARQKLVVCGLPLLEITLEAFGSKATVTLLAEEGSEAKEGDILAEIVGEARDLLAVERTMLNFLQRLSGIASHVRKWVKAGKGITLLDTRKTIPGHRALEKYAVSVGGARNHRFSLSDMALVKNNHIDANAGSVSKTLTRLLEQKPPYMPFEVEVRNEKELVEALPFSPTILMLDNFTNVAIAKALKQISKVTPQPLVEISGGVTIERLKALKKLGVEHVSAGSLTTQATAVDISMRLSVAPRKR